MDHQRKFNTLYKIQIHNENSWADTSFPYYQTKGQARATLSRLKVVDPEHEYRQLPVRKHRAR